MPRADFLAVELSDSFQNLAHRLKAMQHFKQHTRRQWFFISCAIALLGTVGIIPWRVVAQEAQHAAADKLAERSLAEAVKDFNAKASRDDIGKTQPPLTEQEVIAAIEHWSREQTPVSDEIFAIYQQIAKTRQLPAAASFRLSNRTATPAKVINVWWIDLIVPISKDEVFSFRIRDKKLFVEPAQKVEQAWGNLKGRFIYDGEPPQPVPVKVQQDANVFGGLNLVDESLVVAKGRSLANVVVWVRAENLPIHPSYDELKTKSVSICALNGKYEPRILTYWTGQPLNLLNLEPVANNFNANFTGNQAFNVGLKPRELKPWKPLNDPESKPVRLDCNLHPWMQGWVVVQPHPYVAVSGSDGQFELKNLPAGVPLEFQVWQERAGYVQKATRNGNDAGWTKGRFTLTLRPDEILDLGEIKLPAGQFQEEELAQAAAEPAPAAKAPVKVDEAVKSSEPPPQSSGLATRN